MTKVDPRKADAAYKSFPKFATWSKQTTIDLTRWDQYTALLEERKEAVNPEVLKQAQDVVSRAAAIDTGAIEGLYEVDRGFTFTVAFQASGWEAALMEKGDKAKELIESQMVAYDLLFDLATKEFPIAEATIRRLHEELCRTQETYKAYTEVGLQELKLPKGKYKSSPNHVMTGKGNVHSYAPVDLTPVEMHRLIEELNSEDLIKAHPVAQASFVHYALSVIHPFADGNGRVARALSSIFTCRANSIPLMILADDRDDYLTALELADAGNFQPFVDFTLERALDSIQLASESLAAAEIPSTSESLELIKALYVTKGGFSHAQVDEAGQRLLQTFIDEAAKQLKQLTDELGPNVLTANVAAQTGNHTPIDSGYRLPISGHSQLNIVLNTPAPAQAGVHRLFGIDVPKDCGKSDDLVIRSLNDPKQRFGARIREISPSPKTALVMRIRVFTEKVLRQLMKELGESAAVSHG